MSKQIIHTDAAPAAVGPYSQGVATAAGKTVYLSGQIGLEPATGELVSENFEAQVRQAFANMQAVIEAAGGTLDNIVKLTLFLTDLSRFTAANVIMAEIIPQPFPARSTVGVASLPKGAQFEVESHSGFITARLFHLASCGLWLRRAQPFPPPRRAPAGRLQPSSASCARWDC